MWVRHYPGAPQQVQACLLALSLAHTLFCVWSVSISDPTPGCTWVSETEQRAACSGHGDGSGQMPRVPIEKEGWVCVPLAHTLWFIKVLYTMSCLRPDLQGSEIFLGCVSGCVCVLVWGG